MFKINLKNIPDKPGIYIFKNAKNKPLYIGKAKNLRKRISQYFKSNSEKIKKLIEETKNLEFLETKNEIEAIFKESDLIKKLNPIYNHLLRDDSKYFYLIFTKEELPRIFVTHQPEKFSTSEIIGPFFEGSSLKIILNTIRKEIPFCTCPQKHSRICLNANLKLCYGWCCLKNTNLDKDKIKVYNEGLQIIKKIFKQDFKNLKKIILNKIKQLINKNNLEKAYQLKKIYLIIEKLETSQNLIEEKDNFLKEYELRKILEQLKKILKLKQYPHLIEAIDISHFSGKEKVGILVSFLDGIYKPKLLKKFKIKTIPTADDPRMIAEIISRRISHKNWGLPDIILVDGGKIQLKFAEEVIKNNNLNIKVIAFAKPKEELYFNNQKIELKRYPLLKNFIVSIDKKTHQIVIKYHRKLRERSIN